ncbi:hypothetical protein PPL_01244 [Heterostelium album PN500]|uniref:Uncharacterized protein n=1 Tax=Heterostelium pallidum (strain ATCC 26659 / Pp 5 / PN500) TaxID=670386 RepID=D3AYI4_HETP5|nr:hypothetical protein PPL_01244 [Heterostelium album PN500]EFA86011.1 hypothetical protein PPL_01244 [Heterostelium album PN500]|eukprot:XP_020438117.1 hypothetical protein PPL_01244 [Heterostelium album PN500]
MKTNRMKITVTPDTRVAEIYSSPNAVTPEIGPCGGLSLTYYSMCDYMNVQPISEVSWQIEYILAGTDCKEFDYGFFFKKDRLITGDARPLMAALAINSWFTSFIIKGIKLTNECIGSIISLLQQSTSFEKVVLNGIGMDRSACEKLIDAIVGNKTLPLKELDLGNNQIEDKGMIAIADMLKNMQFPLTSLILGGCSVGRSAMSSLGDALGVSESAIQHLRYLDIGGNKLESEGSSAISNFLVKSKRSKTRSTAIESIINLIEKKSRTYNAIKTLVLQGGSKSQLKGDLLPIICSLFYNSTLKELDISGHSIGDVGAAALGKLLQSNFALEKLEWDDNSTTLYGLNLFKVGLSRNNTLSNMPIPMRDIAAHVKSDAQSITRISDLVGEIQQILLDNTTKSATAAAAASASTTPRHSVSSGTLSPTKSRTSSTPPFTIDPKTTTATCAGLTSYNIINDSELVEPLANLVVK